MERADRRHVSRVRCLGAAAHVTVRHGTRAALLADMSLDGLRLRGADLPGPGERVSINIELPPRELPTTGCVMWRDRGGAEIGVHLDDGLPHGRRDLGAMMLAMAFEAEQPRRAAVLLIDDPRRAARLCSTLRHHGYVPCAIATPLDAAVALTRVRPRVVLAIVGARTLGLPAADVVAFLAGDFPDVDRLVIGGPPTTSAGDARLSPESADDDLDRFLAARGR
jgi:hypothetical protein